MRLVKPYAKGIRYIKRLIGALVFQSVIYVIQYLIEPLIIAPSPRDTNLNAAIIIVSTAVVNLLGMQIMHLGLSYYVVSLPIYYIAVQMYHPVGIYGLDYTPFIALTKVEVWVLTLLVGLIEIGVWCMLKLGHKLREWIRK